MKKIILTDVVDERGRWMNDQEFNWLMGRFQDVYHPSKLAMITARHTGLRIGRCCTLTTHDLTEELKRVKTSQNKPHRRIGKDGNIHIRRKPKNVPLGDSLVRDLYNYITHRLLQGKYIGKDLKDLKSMRLFPTTSPQRIGAWMWKIRNKYGTHKPDCPKDCTFHQPWLMEIYATDTHMDMEGNVLKVVKRYRVAPYEGRFYYITKASEVSGDNTKMLQLLSGHDKIEHAMRYRQVHNLEEKKHEIKERFLDKMTPSQLTAVSPTQRNLRKYLSQ